MVLIILSSFLSAFLCIYAFYFFLASEKIEILNRLEKIKLLDKKINELDDELQKSFVERIIKPMLRGLAQVTKKFTPAKKRSGLENKLMLAGNPGGLSASEFLSLHYFTAVFLGAAAFIFTHINGIALYQQYLLSVIVAVMGYLIVELYLNMKISNRRLEITSELPDVLDLLTVSVEAGLGFDAALQKVIHKTKGAISLEFAKTLQEIKMGKQRKEALKDLAERTGVEDLNTVISAIIQADQLGVSIGNVLRVQSEQMRRKRRQCVEEKAMKAPIKMLLPMIFFIFPTIFIVLLGPAVIQMMDNLGSK